MAEESKAKHFVLVHGMCHGAWCWYKVATLLRAGGHKVTTLDMAASGTNPTQVHEVKSIIDYFNPLIEFLGSLLPEERVILVGHSLGGFGISVAMERFPEKISVAVFCAAIMPGLNLSFATLVTELNQRYDTRMDSVYTFDNGLDSQPTSMLFGPQIMSSKLYQLSPPEDLTLAMMLARPHPLSSKEDMLDKGALTEDKYGSVRKVYIICDQDKIVPEEFQRWIIERIPMDNVKLISGSDHMPMFSKPDDLCLCLQEIV